MNELKIDTFTSMPHQTLEGHYRVPVVKEKDGYIVCLGIKFIRRFTLDSLPDFIKGKMSLASARAENIIPDENVTWQDMFTYHGNYDSMEDIGWQVSNSVFIVVINQDEMQLLKGESVISQNANQ